jgi:hypothetical protein
MTMRRKADQPVSAAADSLAEDVNDGSGAANAAPNAATSWDPYEVWLTRVKQPRERNARMVPRLAPRAAPAEIGDANRTTLSPSLSR